jgi:hypothetical protein
MEGLSVLNSMIAPAALITACSLFLLGVYDKYSKIVASLRTLNIERRAITAANPQDASHGSSIRHEEIAQEWPVLRTRLAYALTQMRLITASTALFLIASLVIGSAHLLHIDTTSVALTLVALGLASLLVAMLIAVAEAGMISAAIDLESPSSTQSSELGKAQDLVKSQLA